MCIRRSGRQLLGKCLSVTENQETYSLPVLFVTKKIHEINFRDWRYSRKYFNNKNNPIYGISCKGHALHISGK